MAACAECADVAVRRTVPASRLPLYSLDRRRKREQPPFAGNEFAAQEDQRAAGPGHRDPAQQKARRVGRRAWSGVLHPGCLSEAGFQPRHQIPRGRCRQGNFWGVGSGATENPPSRGTAGLCHSLMSCRNGGADPAIKTTRAGAGKVDFGVRCSCRKKARHPTTAGRSLIGAD